MDKAAERVLGGPNVWSTQPVLEVRLDLGCLAGVSCREIQGFSDRLRGWFSGPLPGRFRPAGLDAFLEQLDYGKTFEDALGQLAAQLQQLAGSDANFAMARRIPNSTSCEVALEIEEEPLAVACLDAAIEVCRSAVEDRACDAAALVRRLRGVAEDCCLGPSTRCIVGAARARGIPVRRLNARSLVQLGQGNRQRRVLTAETDRTPVIAETVSQDKHLTKQLLAAAGVPVPEGRLVSDAADAWAAACQIGPPVVVKPLNGNHGRGVFTDLTRREQVESVFDLALREGAGVMVERFAAGAEHRLLVVGGRVVAAIRGEPVNVAGDGRHTVAELLEALNQDPRRGDDDECPLATLEFDSTTDALVRQQGYSPDETPPPGVKILLQRNGNLSIDVTDQVHPEVAQCAIRATRAVGLDVAGIDLVVRDIGQPLESQGGVVVEVNAGPGLQMHLWPAVGKARPVGEAIVEHLFPPGENGRVPVVGILAADGGRRHASLLAPLLAAVYGEVGVAHRQGVYAGARRVGTPLDSWPAAARQLLMSPLVGAALFDVAPPWALSEGLPFDRCRVAVIEPCRSKRPEDVRVWDVLARVLLRALDPAGAAVLAVDDPACAELAACCPGAAVLTARGSSDRTLREHLARGGKGAFFECGEIVLMQGDKPCMRIELLPASAADPRGTGLDLPTLLSAAAAAWALDLPGNSIRQRLRSAALASEAD